ncbi:MAG TPA: UbiX family flavin prenyltransferase [Candidatus Bathyarchaeia archaeon]|nr:UbiX family flavin prenyltransferase [Candidatus Bathyarchaeia archaeon]
MVCRQPFKVRATESLRLVVAISGASGVVYGKRLLEVLKEKKVETHLIVSKAAEKVIEHELEVGRKDIEKLANRAYDVDDLTAPLMSGSFKTDGMVIIPCSMKTLAGITHGFADNLILRAADVTLKEKRRLVVVPRETPLNVVHLRNMLTAAKLGVFVVPAMPAFYHDPKDISDMVDFVVGRVLDCFSIEHKLFRRYSGMKTRGKAPT